MDTQNNSIYREKNTGSKVSFYLLPISFLPVVVDYFNNKLNKESITASIVLFAVFFLVGFLLKLEWEFTLTNFSYKYRPIYNKWKTIPLSDIKTANIMKINPLREFGGWGFRFGRLGQAFTTTGRIILHIETHSGKRLNFTVKNQLETEIALKKLGFSVLQETIL